MQEYKVIKKNDLSSLTSEVNKHLNNGWELTGGVAFSTDMNNFPMFCQALCKLKESID